MSNNPTSIEELQSILHLSGCQQYTAGYNDMKNDKGFDLNAVEEREATTLAEVTALIEAKRRAGAVEELKLLTDPDILKIIRDKGVKHWAKLRLAELEGEK